MDMKPIKQAVEIIRDLQPADGEAIAGLAKTSFPVNQSGFVTPGKSGGKVIVINGNVVAASLLRVISLPSGRKVGFIAWLMTHPERRGQGLAGKLVAASTGCLASRGCEDIVTDVEGYNTSSANAFHREGYRRLSLGQQFFRWNPVDSIWLSIDRANVCSCIQRITCHFCSLIVGWVVSFWKPDFPAFYCISGFFFGCLRSSGCERSWNAARGVALQHTFGIPGMDRWLGHFTPACDRVW